MATGRGTAYSFGLTTGPIDEKPPARDRIDPGAAGHVGHALDPPWGALAPGHGGGAAAACIQGSMGAAACAPVYVRPGGHCGS